MSVVSLEEVQQWLEPTKLTLTAIDTELYATAREIVFSRVAGMYTVSLWIDAASTPALIRKIVSGHHALYVIRKTYSEALGDSNPAYAVWLEKTLDDLIVGIVAGVIDLLDSTELSAAQAESQPSFWPNDLTGTTQTMDAAGNFVGDQFSEDIKFRMGAKF